MTCLHVKRVSTKGTSNALSISAHSDCIDKRTMRTKQIEKKESPQERGLRRIGSNKNNKHILVKLSRRLCFLLACVCMCVCVLFIFYTHLFVLDSHQVHLLLLFSLSLTCKLTLANSYR